MFQKNNYNSDKLTVILIFTVIAAVFSTIGALIGNQTTEQTIFKALNQMEAYKVGGQENRAALQKLYTNPQFISSQTEQINAALESLGEASTANNTNAPTNTVASNTLSSEQIDNILGNYPMKGNQDSDIIYVEYTDFECPFCQEHYNNKIADSLINSDNIAVMYKNFPLSIHPQAPKAAEGLLCTRHLSGDDTNTYFQYIDKVFQARDPSIAYITQVATELGVSESDFSECLNSGRYASEVAAQMQEGQSIFGVNGTPGNVMINKTTGKFITIPGAQPLNVFTNALTQI